METMGFVERRRDPADERQVRLSLTPAGRRVVEANPGDALMGATGLDEETFPALQTSVARLRGNLLSATKG